MTRDNMYGVYLPLTIAAGMAGCKMTNISSLATTLNLEDLSEPGALLFLEFVALFISAIAICFQMRKEYDAKLWIVLGAVVLLLMLAKTRWNASNPGFETSEACVILLYAIAFAWPYRLNWRKATMVTLLLVPSLANAQSSLELNARYSDASFGFAIGGQAQVPFKNAISVTTGEFVFSKIELHEALLMTGVAWDKRVGELGFVLGSFVEPTEVSENESGYKGPIAFGMGAMAVYSLEKKKFHLHAEAGAGWNFPQIVWLYTARATYLYRDVVFGGQLHYTLGVGPMLGWQMCEHVLLSANAFVNFEGHSTGQLSITVNHIGGNHH